MSICLFTHSPWRFACLVAFPVLFRWFSIDGLLCGVNCLLVIGSDSVSITEDSIKNLYQKKRKFEMRARQMTCGKPIWCWHAERSSVCNVR
ncbi:hypothetical protein Q1695_006447 [Nippostrongylus brasiliensis]|nr:hypothetical protein Q1695_006447 [Nippostrongylus brasiliensis]